MSKIAKFGKKTQGILGIKVHYGSCNFLVKTFLGAPSEKEFENNKELRSNKSMQVLKF
jgi:hypothetical protein